MATRRKRKSPSTKVVLGVVYDDGSQWTVHSGELRRLKGNPGKTKHLFRVVAEKLPYGSLPAVRGHMKAQGLSKYGVYVAHDSMGFARYIGRGNIFGRLRTRRGKQKLELAYYSFYVVSEKKHEREIETALIRAAGPLLEFNTRKKRVGIQPGRVRDYEAGTYFYERQYKKGRKT